MRTTTAQLRLLEDYPEHVFAHSQAQHYAWLRDRAPELYARVREAVAAGRWIPVGGTWIEPDCNLPVRGVARAPVPLRPAVLRGRARPPLHGVLEPGRLRLHRPAAAADARGRDLALPDPEAVLEPLHAARAPHVHLAGPGRLGGADPLPARGHLQRRGDGRRAAPRGRDLQGPRPLAPLADGLRARRRRRRADRRDARAAAPRARHRRAAEDDGPLAGRVLRRCSRPTRATCGPSSASSTSSCTAAPTPRRPQVKRLNRRAEGALREAELLSALASDAPYPREAARPRCGRRCCSTSSTTSCRAARSPRSTSRARDDLAGVVDGAEAICARRARRARAAAQPDAVRAPRGRRATRSTPSRRTARASRSPGEVTVDGLVLANEHLRATLSPDGTVTSLVCDGREALAAPANRLELYEDEPTHWEAWDIDPAHLETGQDLPPARAHRVAGDARCAPRSSSTATGSPRRSGSTPARAASRSSPEVDWQLDRKLLKVAFPLAVRATDVTYEVAFGAVQRPTHYSTPRRPRALRGARPPLGRHVRARLRRRRPHRLQVRLLGVRQHVADLAPARPAQPRPGGRPRQPPFAYALLPHTGSWQDAGVVAQAAAFNSPVRWGALPAGSLASATGGLVLDTVKRAEDSDALILRLYEPHGGRGTARIRVPATRAWRANILEDRGEALPIEDGEIVVAFRPWEIVTVYVPPRPPPRSRSSRSRSSRPCAARSPRTPRRPPRGSCRRTRRRARSARPAGRRGWPRRGRTGRPRRPARAPAARGWSRRRRRRSAAAPRRRRAPRCR